MKRKRGWVVFGLVLIIVLAYIILDISGLSKTYTSMTEYVFKPVIWGTLFAIVFIIFRKKNVEVIKGKNEVIVITLIMTIAYIVVYFFIGFIKSFGYNPYNRTFMGLLLNFWSFITIIFYQEYIRIYLIKNSEKDNLTRNIFLIALLFVLPHIEVNNLKNYFDNASGIYQLIFGFIIPKIALSLLLTYIGYYSNFWITSLYRALPIAVILVLPILPNLDWLLEGMLITLFAFITFIVSKGRLNKLLEKNNKQVFVYSTKSWAIPLIIVLIGVSFVIGIFPIKPVVIATGSMEPNINKGDLVFLFSANASEVAVGDVIQYSLENYHVVHRVIEIGTDSTGETYFITKGDNNSSQDALLVRESQVIGTIKGRVPLLGYPTLLVDRLINGNNQNRVIVETGN